MRLLFCILLSLSIRPSCVGQIVEIADTSFLNTLIEKGIDQNGDSLIHVSEALATTHLSIENPNIQNIGGIEEFKNLIVLNVVKSQIKTVNLEGLDKLAIIDFGQNEVDEFTLGDKPVLVMLDLSFNRLTQLDLPDLPAIGEINLSYNKGLEGTFGHMPQLSSLKLNGIGYHDFPEFVNRLSSQLKKLHLSSNNIDTVFISDFPELTNLFMSGNKMVAFDIRQCPKLVNVSLSGNLLTAATDSLIALPQLEILDLSINKLSYFEMPAQSALRRLILSQNELISCILNQQDSLERLELRNNELFELDLSGCSALWHITLNTNRFRHMDYDSLPSARVLDVSFNPLSTLRIAHCDSLEQLMVNGVKSDTEVCIGHLPALKSLSFGASQFSQYDLLDLPSLEFFSWYSSREHQIDLSAFPKLSSVNLEGSLVKNINIRNQHSTNLNVLNTPVLQSICCDADEIGRIQDRLTALGKDDVRVSSSCPFATPQGYTLPLTARLDIDQNGCNSTDPLLDHLAVSYTTANTSQTIQLTPGKGRLSLPTDAAQLRFDSQHPAATLTPSTAQSSPALCSNPLELCASLPNDYKDLRLDIIPTQALVAGEPISIVLHYQNLGTMPLSGNIVLDWNDRLLPYSQASQEPYSRSAGQAIWEFEELAPGQSEQILLHLDCNSTAQVPAAFNGRWTLMRGSIAGGFADPTPENSQISRLLQVKAQHTTLAHQSLKASYSAPISAGQAIPYIYWYRNRTGETVDDLRLDLNLEGLAVSRMQSHSIASSLSGSLSGNQGGLHYIDRLAELSHRTGENDYYLLIDLYSTESLDEGDRYESTVSAYQNDANTIDDQAWLEITQDADGDGFATPIDCNDDDPLINPDAVEIVGNGIDEDCYYGDRTVSVVDHDGKPGLSVWPNPSTRWIKVASGGGLLSIWSSTGQLMLEQTVGELARVDMEGWAEGLYVVQLNNGLSVKQYKFLKN